MSSLFNLVSKVIRKRVPNGWFSNGERPPAECIAQFTPTTPIPTRQDRLVLSCRWCEQNWRQVKTRTWFDVTTVSEPICRDETSQPNNDWLCFEPARSSSVFSGFNLRRFADIQSSSGWLPQGIVQVARGWLAFHHSDSLGIQLRITSERVYVHVMCFLTTSARSAWYKMKRKGTENRPSWHRTMWIMVDVRTAVDDTERPAVQMSWTTGVLHRKCRIVARDGTVAHVYYRRYQKIQSHKWDFYRIKSQWSYLT